MSAPANLVSFHQWLRTTRSKRKLSTQEVADRAGLSNSQIWTLEAAGSIPKLDTFIRLCHALDVAPGTALAKIGIVGDQPT